MNSAPLLARQLPFCSVTFKFTTPNEQNKHGTSASSYHYSTILFGQTFIELSSLYFSLLSPPPSFQLHSSTGVGNYTSLFSLHTCLSPTGKRNIDRPRKRWKDQHPWRRNKPSMAYTQILLVMMIPIYLHNLFPSLWHVMNFHTQIYCFELHLRNIP